MPDPTSEAGGASASNPTPERIGAWRVERELGRGGMAVVYAVRGDEGRPAALKWLLRVTPRRLARFQEEARFLERLQHSNVARFRARGESDGRPWLVLDLVDGPDLRLHAEKLRARPPAEREAQVRSIARDLARALGYVHAHGVVHRDVKPANVLLGPHGAVLTDFGVAFSLVDEGAAEQGELVGTAAWGAPEQLGGRPVDARADQYGLGGTLYLLLTGRRPFEEDDPAALVHAHLERPVRPPSQLDPTVPPDLEALVLRLLAKSPSDRFPDMQAVEQAIGADRADNLPLAGRQAQIDAVAAAVEQVAGGAPVVLELEGAVGSGRHWLRDLAREAAARRGVRCVAGDDPAAQSAARVRADAGEPILVVDLVGAAAESISLRGTRVRMAPLGLADLRRSVYALAPATTDLARVAERLHRESGGNAGLFMACAAAVRRDDAFVVPDGPLDIDVAPWLDGMEVDEEFVAFALAALPLAATVATLEDVAQVPAKAALRALVGRGVAIEVDGRWILAAEVLRAPLLARVPDRETLDARARAHLPTVEDVPDPVLAEVARLRADGRVRDAVAPLEAALHEPALAVSARAARLLALGALCWSIGDPARARQACESALPLLAEPGLRSRAHVGAGASALQLGEPAAALDHLEAARVEADLAGDLGRGVLALVNLAEARSLAGNLAGALADARRAVGLAAGLRDRAIEGMAIRHLGQVLLEMGQYVEAGQRLADAAALARAADLTELRASAWSLRARTHLEARPGDRVAAAAALDRLRPLLGESHGLVVDPEGTLPRARATWLRVAARLGDRGMVARARDACEPGLADLRVPLRTEVLLTCAHAALELRDGGHAAQLATRAHELALAHGLALLAWRSARLLARVAGAPLPEVGALAHGLPEGDVRALEASA